MKMILGLGLEPDSLVKNIVLEPSRGNIYAADGNILATSISRLRIILGYGYTFRIFI